MLSRVERGRLDHRPGTARAAPAAGAHRRPRGAGPAVDRDGDCSWSPTCRSSPAKSTYVEQIIRNLLGNAAKYTPAGDDGVVVSAGDAAPSRSASPTTARASRRPRSGGRSSCSTATRTAPGRCPDRGSGCSSAPAWSRRWAAGSGPRAGREGGSEFGFTMRVLEADAFDAGAFELEGSRPRRSSRPTRARRSRPARPGPPVPHSARSRDQADDARSRHRRPPARPCRRRAGAGRTPRAPSRRAIGVAQAGDRQLDGDDARAARRRRC